MGLKGAPYHLGIADAQVPTPAWPTCAPPRCRAVSADRDDRTIFVTGEKDADSDGPLEVLAYASYPSASHTSTTNHTHGSLLATLQGSFRAGPPPGDDDPTRPALPIAVVPRRTLELRPQYHGPDLSSALREGGMA